MALELRFQHTGRLLEARLAGDLVLGPWLRQFADQCRDTVASSRPGLLTLDLTGVVNMDSAGLGELVILYTSSADLHCRMALVNPSPRILHLLAATRLDGLMPSFSTVDEAAGALLAK